MHSCDIRVVVTGLGVIAPCGLDAPSFWKAVVEGKSAAATVRRFPTEAFPCKIGCEVQGFDPADFMNAKKAQRLDPSIAFGIAAAKQAIDDAGLDLSAMDPDRIGIVDGMAVCGLHRTLEAQTRFLRLGYKGVQPTQTTSAFAGATSSEIAIQLGVTNQAVTIATACSSANDALAYAAYQLQSGIADVIVAGAEEAPIVEAFYSLFINLGVMSHSNDDPPGAMRPFDRDRNGFVLGEGAAFLVLESLPHALARGARIYCELSGHGRSCDAYSPVGHRPDGKGMKKALERALYSAQVPRDSIDYINAHGSATEKNEVIETSVYHEIFRHHARRLSISATKPVTGHLMGATAALESVICALSIYEKIVPPTINLANPDPDCDLDYVPREARRLPVRRAVNVNLGFGGKNSALIFSEFRDV
jgi:3-oxoacyl-[acyl-carrier-protein] synthase II